MAVRAVFITHSSPPSAPKIAPWSSHPGEDTTASAVREAAELASEIHVLDAYPQGWITLRGVKRSPATTAPTAEKPVLTDEQRAERLRLLAERLRNPDGFDRDTLERIEQLTGNEQ